jgi:hypothetical protein
MGATSAWKSVALVASDADQSSQSTLAVFVVLCTDTPYVFIFCL